MSLTAAICRPAGAAGLAAAFIGVMLAKLKVLQPARPEVRERAALMLDRHGDRILRCAIHTCTTCRMRRRCSRTRWCSI